MILSVGVVLIIVIVKKRKAKKLFLFTLVLIALMGLVLPASVSVNAAEEDEKIVTVSEQIIVNGKGQTVEANVRYFLSADHKAIDDGETSLKDADVYYSEKADVISVTDVRSAADVLTEKCAYAKQHSWVDQQEIFGFENGEVVSLFTGDINNMGTSVEPFVMLMVDDSQVYCISGRQQKEGGDAGSFAAVENGRCISGTADSALWKEAMPVNISVGAYGLSDLLRDTKQVMKALRCREYNIIDKAEYDKQIRIYKLYVSSDEWRNADGLMYV